MKIKILIIENDEDVSREYCSLINNEDLLSAEIALSGKNGLELINEKHFDIVIADLFLGDTTGLSILKKIKTHTPNTDFIIITAHPSSETIKEAIKGGAFDYLIRPFSDKELLNKLYEVVKKRKGGVRCSQSDLSRKEKRQRISEDLIKLTKFKAQERFHCLWLVLSKIASKPILKNSLLLKGGAAINLTYFPDARYVSGLQFDFFGCQEKEEMLEVRKKISETIVQALQEVCVVKKPPSKTRYVFDHFQAKFRVHAFKTHALKIDINYLNRLPLLGAELRTLSSPFSDIASVEFFTYTLNELLAMKLSSLSNTCSAKDLFDIVNIRKAGYDLGIVTRLALFYCYIKTGKITEFKKASWHVNALKNVEIEKNLIPSLKKKTFVSGDEMKSQVLSMLSLFAEEKKAAGIKSVEDLFEGSGIKERALSHPGLKHEKFIIESRQV